MVCAAVRYGHQTPGFVFREMRSIIPLTTGICIAIASFCLCRCGPVIRLEAVAAHAGPVEVRVVVERTTLTARPKMIDPELLGAACAVLMDQTVGATVSKV